MISAKFLTVYIAAIKIKVQECDATGDATYSNAGNKKVISSSLLFF